MKVETVRTTTLYLTLAASELILTQANSCQVLPQLSHDLILFPDPKPGPPNILARIQLRADYLNRFDLCAAGHDALEICVHPEEIADFNRNLVGPLVFLESPPASEYGSSDFVRVSASPALLRSGHPA